ncbi:MAG: hypothetical protein R3D98_01010 [Candidatus Krumholzibacteriia bacterium]
MSRSILTLTLCLVVLMAAGVDAAPLVENPATPSGGTRTITLHEVWRAGGESDDVFFGSVGRVLAGPDQTVLVLDTQQSQVQVYGRDGTWLRTLGREGDGPGEVRGPADAFALPDGRLCIAQSSPGRFVYLNQDGTPGGGAQYQPRGEPATFSVCVAGRPAPGGFVLAGIRFKQQGPQAQQTFFLSRCDVEGVEQVVYLEKVYGVNYADFRLDEDSMDFVWMGRMDVDRAGRIYVGPERDRYLIQVLEPDGTLVRQFTRPVTVPARTAEEHAIAVKIHEAIGAHYGVPLQGVTVAARDAAIGGLWVRPDGEVWVQTPANQPPAGAFALLDVFDPAGRFVRQVALVMPGDPKRDGLYLLDDGRVAVAIGGLDAFLSQQGVAGSSDDAPVLEVVVYDAI